MAKTVKTPAKGEKGVNPFAKKGTVPAKGKAPVGGKKTGKC